MAKKGQESVRAWEEYYCVYQGVDVRKIAYHVTEGEDNVDRVSDHFKLPFSPAD